MQLHRCCQYCANSISLIAFLIKRREIAFSNCYLYHNWHYINHAARFGIREFVTGADTKVGGYFCGIFLENMSTWLLWKPESAIHVTVCWVQTLLNIMNISTSYNDKKMTSTKNKKCLRSFSNRSSFLQLRNVLMKILKLHRRRW